VIRVNLPKYSGRQITVGRPRPAHRLAGRNGSSVSVGQLYQPRARSNTPLRGGSRLRRRHRFAALRRLTDLNEGSKAYRHLDRPNRSPARSTPRSPIVESVVFRRAALFHRRRRAPGTAIPLSEIGTDPQHVRPWRQVAAERMNPSLVSSPEHSEWKDPRCYVVETVVGVWLLGRAANVLLLR